MRRLDRSRGQSLMAALRSLLPNGELRWYPGILPYRAVFETLAFDTSQTPTLIDRVGASSSYCRPQYAEASNAEG